MSGFSQAFDRALVIASLVHEGVARKGTVIPYIIHPVHVAAVLLRHGYPETLAVAAVLHDVLEDIDYGDGRLQVALRSAFPYSTLPDRIVDRTAFRPAFGALLEQEFSPDVLQLVHAVSERKNDGGPERSWLDRKQEAIAHLREAPDEVLVLKTADVIHNVRSILDDMDHHGATVLGRFKASPLETAWHYGEVARVVAERLGEVPITRELLAATRELADRAGAIAGE